MISRWAPLILIVTSIPIRAMADPSLWVVEVAHACSPTDYSIDQELKEIRAASTIAFSDAKRALKSCKATLHQHIVRGQEEDLVTEIALIPKTSSPVALVGFSRTNTARLAALFLKKTSIVGISVGAAAANVRNINPHFYSVASSWENQWSVIRQALIENKCNKIIGLFNPSSFLSKLYQDRFQESKLGEVVRTDTFKGDSFPASADCLFFGSNYFDSVTAFESAVRTGSIRFIITTGDWVMAQNEILKLNLQPTRHIEVVSASGWKDEHGRGKKLAEALIPYGVTDPSPIAPYTYDAVVVALDYLCNGRTPSKSVSPPLAPLLIRDYSGVNETGNFISPIHLRKLVLTKGRGAADGN